MRSSRLGLVACVILDLALPGMSGLEVQHQLAARGLQIPIVVVTANRDDRVGQRAAAAGALAVLRKPVNHEELINSLSAGGVGRAVSERYPLEDPVGDPVPRWLDAAEE